jgi:hypothetical protein
MRTPDLFSGKPARKLRAFFDRRTKVSVKPPEIPPKARETAVDAGVPRCRPSNRFLGFQQVGRSAPAKTTPRPAQSPRVRARRDRPRGHFVEMTSARIAGRTPNSGAAGTGEATVEGRTGLG